MDVKIPLGICYCNARDPHPDAGEKTEVSAFTPDHNGECLHCDNWADAHGPNGECPRNELFDAFLAEMKGHADRYCAKVKPEDRPEAIQGLIDAVNEAWGKWK
jgi:hypothetical protein